MIDHVAELERLGKEYERLERERAATLEAIGAAMVAAKGSVSVREMATLASVTRVTAYRLMEKAEGTTASAPRHDESGPAST